ncbi:Lrp/AsnC family transcriptional regulator [Oricola nitratireducens]|jgi:Lrp/AsnC family transcriptional regulator, leucine-responsive regulatory protein|uniref:Lrp/AsnC family transcriptional regulator n=1 Tax=Oricola nitratireducens TaxID=2775868 RepID=UPI0018677582|nr:Lrp/AsnC family transcriptional regulator [Oricola nitratireducens]
MTQTAPLSETDRRLLAQLQEDCRISNQELANAAGMSASACWRRVRALEEEGVISGYVALVDAERVGQRFSAIVQLTLERHERDHVDNFIDAISRRPEVLQVFATTGEADYHVLVLCEDKDAYNAFLEDFLFRLPGIAHVRTNLVLKSIKSTPRIPL